MSSNRFDAYASLSVVVHILQLPHVDNSSDFVSGFSPAAPVHFGSSSLLVDLYGLTSAACCNLCYGSAFTGCTVRSSEPVIPVAKSLSLAGL